jgi:hypothetical protein
MPARFAAHPLQPIGQIRCVEFDLQNKLGLFEAFEGSYDPGPPPMVTLLQMAAGILIDPVDWVMTGIEVIQDIQRGDYGSAALNLTLAVTPFLSGQADELLVQGRAALGQLFYVDYRMYAFAPGFRPVVPEYRLRDEQYSLDPNRPPIIDNGSYIVNPTATQLNDSNYPGVV